MDYNLEKKACQEGGAFLAFPCSPCYNVFRKNSVELRCRLKEEWI